MRRDPLLPTPARLRPRDGRFRLRPRVPIVLHPGSTDSDLDAARALERALVERGAARLSIESQTRADDLGARIELRRAGEGGESYRLDVRPERVVVTGSGAAGLRYGVETLAQLAGRGGKSLPCCEIEDQPALERRGLLVDVSRGKVPTLETLRGLVDLMVRLKLNLLMLYTEHVFRFRRHPLIGRDDSPMTAEELLELDAYAARRHVELVPTLQSLGHMHQILKHPRYRHLAESERRWSLSPALPESYALLEDLFSEYLPNFRSQWVNVNCDEPVDLGKGLSKEWAEREGVGTVFRTHLERMQALAAKLGKRTMAWADVVFEHPEQIPLLPRDLVLLDWWYEANHDFDRVRLLARHDIPFMVAAGTSSWNTLFPRLTNAVANIRGHAEAGKKHGALGLIVTDWGDGGHYNLLGNSLFAIAWGAQAAWGRTDVSDRDFDRAFSLSLFSDSTGAVARLHRRLGDAHRAGFEHFNNSPLKSLYFDDLREPKFVPKAKRRALAATGSKLAAIAAAVERQAAKLASRPTDLEELVFAVDASRLAVDKALAGLDYLDAEGQSARRRRALSKRLRDLASRQRQLERRHRALWLARNRPSNYEITRGYYDASIRGLERAARALGRRPRRRSTGGYSESEPFGRGR